LDNFSKKSKNTKLQTERADAIEKSVDTIDMMGQLVKKNEKLKELKLTVQILLKNPRTLLI